MKAITLKKKKVMLLKRKVTVLRKMLILKIVKRMRVLMMEILINISKKLHETWCHLSPPINENEIVGKWFKGIYETTSKRLCIGQLIK